MDPHVQIDAEKSPRVCCSIAATVAEIAKVDEGRIALRRGDRTLTYGDLVRRASRLADRLAMLGVGPEVPVGVCLPRSFDWVTAMLAVSFAGGAFIPLDPAWPDERLQEILDDAGARIVVAPSAPNKLPDTKCSCVSVEDACSDGISERLLEDVPPDRLAYIIYTSGSTGRPKGVEITHGNLQSLISWHLDAFRVTQDDRASSIAGLGFDAAVWEIWPYLVAGASIAIVDEELRTSARHLQDWLVRQRVTVSFMPTPLAETLIRAEWPSDTSLRLLLTGGDALHNWPAPDLPFVVVNNYGPTECTVVTTSGVVGPRNDKGSLPTIGQPIRGTSVRILDPSGKPVPNGVIGELCVGGACVGRGYRGRPDLTREKFIEGENGERLYRTGDLCAFLPSGEIAFHGRLDTQSKLRGHRIEIDEVTAALNRHPIVSQSAVTIGGDTERAQLTAYIVSNSAERPRVSEIRDLLVRSLPDYMIPSRYILIDSLPLTSNGKISRTELPEPNENNVLRDVPYRAPQTITESRLAEMMADLLGFGPIGADDNFFLMGGHSLLGSQLALRVREAFNANVTLRDVFRTQTVSRLAAKVEEIIVTKLQNLSEEEAEKLAAE